MMVLRTSSPIGGRSTGLLMSLMVALGSMSFAHADINGFGFLLDADWAVSSDAGNPPLPIEEGRIRLTNADQEFQSRSLFYRQQQSITQFVAEFTYEADNLNASESGGLCFVLQRNSVPRRGNCCGEFGWQNGGFSQSLAITLNLNGSRSGLFQDGTLGSSGEPTAPVNLRSGNPIRVTLNYDGQLLRVTFEDTVTGEVNAFPPYPINIPASLGGATTAWVGFTTGTRFGMREYLDDFTYVATNPPCPGPMDGDLDRDGDVDLTDLATMLINFGRACL